MLILKIAEHNQIQQPGLLLQYAEHLKEIIVN